MISIILGNVGSGKTASVVKEMVLNPAQRATFSNIVTRKIKNNIVISPDMIIKKELKYVKKSGEEVFSYKLNKDFWMSAIEKHKAINVIIDEAHSILNARRTGSKTNIIMSNFMSLLRRILGSTESGMGSLTLISQLERRIDPIAKEMCTHVKFTICHYKKSCNVCGFTWQENNENPDPKFACKKCRSHLITKHDHVIEVWCFKTIEHFIRWKYFGKRSYYSRYLIRDIEKYFAYYNTLQWDNLLYDY